MIQLKSKNIELKSPFEKPKMSQSLVVRHLIDIFVKHLAFLDTFPRRAINTVAFYTLTTKNHPSLITVTSINFLPNIRYFPNSRLSA